MCNNNDNVNAIEAKDMNIEEFLKGSENITIPRYQRSYAWDTKNIELFLKDVKTDYYIGNIIEYKHNNNKEIVDGQQRIITIFLTLIAIHNLLEENEKDIKNEIEKLIIFNGKCKISIKERIANEGQEILEYLIKNRQIPKELEQKYNEIRAYRFICKLLANLNKKEIYQNIKNSVIVEIAFTQNERSAHEMFVNLNTKGKPLDMIEILKSQLFKFLSNDSNSDIYKESWASMLKNISTKDYDAYCSDVYLLDYFMNTEKPPKGNYTTSGSVDENCLKLINSINSEERALKIFHFMTDSKMKDVYLVYRSIKSHKIIELQKNYYSNKLDKISFGELDEIWYLYGEFGFKQSDILFTSIFYNKEKFFVNNSGFVNLFMKYIFMYELYRSISQNSPASYANIFKQEAAKVINCQDINKVKENLKKFTSSLKISDPEYEAFKEKLTKNETFDNSKHKNGKFIILMAEEFYTKNLSIEHFIAQKTNNNEDKKYIGALGNLIPVTKDRYKNKSVEEKLKLYEDDKDSNKGIKNFLKYGFNEKNYEEKIEERSKNLAEKFIEKMKDYYNKIQKG